MVLRSFVFKQNIVDWGLSVSGNHLNVKLTNCPTAHQRLSEQPLSRVSADLEVFPFPSKICIATALIVHRISILFPTARGAQLPILSHTIYVVNTLSRLYRKKPDWQTHFSGFIFSLLHHISWSVKHEKLREKSLLGIWHLQTCTASFWHCHS